MANILNIPEMSPDPDRQEQPAPVDQRSPVPHERHPHPSQRAYGNFRSRFLETLTKPRRSRIFSGLQHIARSGFLILDMPARWLMDLCDAVSGNRGYLAVGSVLAAYLAAFGLIDTRSTQEETRASVERSLFITLVSSGNAASFIAAMKDFGPIQTMPATERPSLLKFWQWGRTQQPNREPMWHWAGWRLTECKKEVKDCSLKAELRLDLGDANLSKAQLSGANLIDANLSGANLIDANLIDANLRRANLIDANLSSAILRYANLIDANLSGANLIDANLIDANLINADLRRANLIDANLSSANLSGANLSDANLRGANLRYTILSGTNLTGARYSAKTTFPADFDPKADEMVLTAD
jgi:hypothetical protein